MHFMEMFKTRNSHLTEVLGSFATTTCVILPEARGSVVSYHTFYIFRKEEKFTVRDMWLHVNIATMFIFYDFERAIRA